MPSNVRFTRTPGTRPTSTRWRVRALATAIVVVAAGALPVEVFAATPPVNTSPPTVSGTALPGAVLSATSGTWTSPGQLQTTVQWQRCSSPASCTPIFGATGAAYTVSIDDVGWAIRVAVTATNHWGSTTATSALTATVAASGHGSAAPLNTAPPLVSGTARVGSVLSSTAGSWSGTTPIGYGYQWRRCDTAGGGCTAILGATSPTFTPTLAEVGATLRSAVTATNSAGAATATSAATSSVLAFEPAPSGSTRPIAVSMLGRTWGSVTGLDRYAYVIVGRAQATAAVLLPGRALVYHSGTSVNVNWDSGIPYSVALANGWLLRNASGQYLKNLQYPDNYIGDVGSAAYQSEWARRVGDYLASVGADGVHIDDVIGDIAAMSGQYPAKYPNQPAWENAMAAFVAAVGPTLKSRGFYVSVAAHTWISGNPASDDGSLDARWWQRLGPSVSALFTEYWVQDPTNVARLRARGSDWWNNWDGWQNLVRVAQATGADFFGYTLGPGSNTRAMRYGKASFLLDWDGGGGAFIYRATDASDPWNAAWTADLGRPTAGKTSLSGGVVMRRFERGIVLVNPTLAAATVTVDGVPRTIGAVDALILTT